MPDQYVATDKRTGVEVTVQGDFPTHPDDRIRIARTTNLFTRLMSTILVMEQESARREGFVAIETQLEMAEALIRGDMTEVQGLVQKALERMGITPEQMKQVEDEIRSRLQGLGHDFPAPSEDRGTPLDDIDLPPDDRETPLDDIDTPPDDRPNPPGR